MNTGKLSEQTLAGPRPAETLTPSLNEYARWLLADARTLEVWCLAGARLARVECTAKETQALELDSGDWFLVRVSALRVPTTPPTIPELTGIVRCLRIGGSGEGNSGQAGQ
jgi:hypothetical protein